MIQAMRYRQGDRCAICLAQLPIVPAIDHDHAAAKTHGHRETVGCGRCVRGLLCNSCNLVLGYAADKPEILDRAAMYLRAWLGKTVDRSTA
jgi:hypothetical protein